jgi:hypothetical protein
MRSKKLDELIVGNFAGLGQTVHTTTNFNIDETLFDTWCQVVGFDDVSRDHVNGDSHVHTVPWGFQDKNL